jgi:hypothetical protein
MMISSRQLFLFWSTFFSLTLAQQYDDGYQDYQEYADGHQQDNLYADYAMKQQDKVVG